MHCTCRNNPYVFNVLGITGYLYYSTGHFLSYLILARHRRARFEINNVGKVGLAGAVAGRSPGGKTNYHLSRLAGRFSRQKAISDH